MLNAQIQPLPPNQMPESGNQASGIFKDLQVIPMQQILETNTVEYKGN